jgi:hypothetical protein
MEEGIGAATCPSCGLAVSPGYPKCPKCHAAMPTAASFAPASSDARNVQGGTAVGGGVGSLVWIAVAGVVAVVAVVVYVASGSSKDEAPAPAPTMGPVDPTIDPTIDPTMKPAIDPARPDLDPFAGTGPDPAAVAKADRARARSRAAERIGAALDSARMWGTIEVQGEELHIHSAYCPQITDERLEAGRDDSGAPLFAAVSCFERHGPLVWERPLSGGAAASP